MQPYRQLYVDTGFERLALFKALGATLRPQTVLYAGSSVHITPSFVFQNVTYVDPSGLAAGFFQNMEEVREFIEKNKSYRQKTFIRYIEGKVENCRGMHLQFDLAMSLYSGAIGSHCWPLLRPGGHYVGNNHLGDMAQVLALPDAGYLGFFCQRRTRYEFTEAHDPDTVEPPPETYRGHKGGAITYLENEKFYLVRKQPKKIAMSSRGSGR